MMAALFQTRQLLSNALCSRSTEWVCACHVGFMQVSTLCWSLHDYGPHVMMHCAVVLFVVVRGGCWTARAFGMLFVWVCCARRESTTVSQVVSSHAGQVRPAHIHMLHWSCTHHQVCTPHGSWLCMASCRMWNTGYVCDVMLIHALRDVKAQLLKLGHAGLRTVTVTECKPQHFQS
jgi:hypothetical protein